MNRAIPRRNLLFPLLCVLVSCSGRQPGIEVREANITLLQYDAGREALARFKPAREAVLTGGECLEDAMPDPNVRRLIARFPNRRNPQTSIAVLVDSLGKPRRFVEERGVLPPVRSEEDVRAQIVKLVRTIIQLDYVTGEALVVNTGPGYSEPGVRGSVTEFDGSTLLGSVGDRIQLVRRVCGGS